MSVAAPRLAVAGLSVRWLAEAAQREGCAVMALDLFGDEDTRAAAESWWPLGEPGALQIDPVRLRQGLAEAARWGAQGWLAGTGFEAHPEWLDQGAEWLPLWGTPGAAVAALREPGRFFEGLAVWGMPHPPVVRRRPADVQSWLAKDFRGWGGWHVRAARPDDADPPAAGHYWQQRAPGRPMSMTLLAAAGRAVVLGCNEQIVQPLRGRPFVFQGVVGPVALPGRVLTALQGMADRLALGHDLRGLVGVDFLLHGEEIALLEVNPRPPAAAALYAEGAPGLIEAHRAACELQRLPNAHTLDAWRDGGRPRGLRYVFARRTMPLSALQLQWLRAQGVHDRPAAPVVLAAGDPLCTVQAVGDEDSADAVNRLKDRLAERARCLLDELETLA